MCSPTVTLSKRRETSLGKSWKNTTLWFPGGLSNHYRCWSAILVTTAMTQPPPLFPHPPPTSALPLFNEVWGYHDGKIVELKMFVGTFRASWRFNALNYFPLKQKGKFPRPISLFVCRPRISVTHFASTGCLIWTPLVAVNQKANPAYPWFYNGGRSRRMGMARGSGGRKSPSGVQGQSPGRGPGDEVPRSWRKMWNKCTILTCSCRTFRI